MRFLQAKLRGGPVWSVQAKKGARDAGISEITLKRAKAALGVRSEKEADGSRTWLLAEAKGIEEGQSPENDLLGSLHPLPITEPLSTGREDQGIKELRQGKTIILPSSMTTTTSAANRTKKRRPCARSVSPRGISQRNECE
jgi:hypothetical protein